MTEKEFIEKLKTGCVFASETLQFIEQYNSRIAFLEDSLDIKDIEIKRLKKQKQDILNVVRESIKKPETLSEAMNNMYNLYKLGGKYD